MEARSKHAAKLRARADKLEERGERELSAERLEDTPKRATEAVNARKRARRQITMAGIIRRVAALAEEGELEYLPRVRSSAEIESIDLALRHAMWARQRHEQRFDEESEPVRADIEHATFPHPHVRRATLRELLDAGAQLPNIDELRQAVQPLTQRTDGFLLENPAEFAAVEELLEAVRKQAKLPFGAGALLASVKNVKRLRRLGITNTAQLREALEEYFSRCRGAFEVGSESPLEQRKRELRFAGIPGYFPTPRPLAEELVAHANIEAGMRVLEPSAGAGAIVAVIREQHPEAVLEVIERQVTLRELLEAEGFELVGDDFTTFEPEELYDRIVMNPPFERRQDIRHIARALGMLAAGGRLVAIAAGGFEQRREVETMALREAVTRLGGRVVPLPAGSFRVSGTSAGAVMIIVDAAPVGSRSIRDKSAARRGQHRRSMGC